MKAARPTLAFGKESVEKYREVNRKLFNEQLSNKELFFMAVGFGVQFAARVKKFERSSTGARTELTDDDLYLLQAVAFDESENAIDINTLSYDRVGSPILWIVCKHLLKRIEVLEARLNSL